MSFVADLQRARSVLAQEGRLSIRGLGLELGREGDALDALVEELVEAQQVATREGRVLVWVGDPEPAAISSGSPARSGPIDAPAITAERRQLTVFFCDLVGSTALAERFDPEDWREIVGSYQRSVGAAIEQYDGSIAQYLGDGVLAYFGYPTAHEDAAERAVRSGLALLQEMQALNAELEREHGIQLALRIGVHTGPVVVGEMGGHGRRETLALGTTPNLAARLQDCAKPDSLVLSAATLHLVQGIFVTEDLGAFELKGIVDPVRVYRADRASGIRSRIDALAASALTPLVARSHELGVLSERWAGVREGIGQVVLVGGDAGLGKSRLVQSFRERISQDAYTWLECQCTPYTRATALFPIIELQQQGLAIRPEDTEAEKIQKVRAALEAVDLATDRNVALVASLHGVEESSEASLHQLSPEGRRHRTLELLRDWLLRLGQSQPLVLLIEDLHWMDPTSIELLGQVFEELPTSQLFAVATHRPEFSVPWEDREYLTRLQLPRLTRTQMRELVMASSDAADLPPDSIDEIVRRSDGVPLFGEELARSVVQRVEEAGADTATVRDLIPETLQDSLMQRLDRLGPVKEIAQLGAVLGREFSYELIRAVSPLVPAELDAALTHATGEELFYRRGTPPEATYSFKHALIRDAAYQSLLRSVRRELHLRAANALTERFPTLTARQPELVARHLSSGGDPREAIEWWQRAGSDAERRGACEEGIANLRNAVELLPAAEPTERGHLEHNLQSALARMLSAARGWGHDETIEALRRARELSEYEDDPVRRAAIFYVSASAAVAQGQHAGSLEPYARVFEIGSEAGNTGLEGAAQLGMAISHFYQGHFPKSLEHLDRAAALFTQPHAPLIDFAAEDLQVALAVWEGWIAWFSGQPDRSISASDRSVSLARASNDAFSLAFALSFGASIAVEMRLPERAHAFAEETATLSRELGFPLHEALSMMLSGLVAAARRDTSGFEQHAIGMARLAATGNLGGASLTFALLARAQTENGLMSEAKGTLDLAKALIVPGEACCDAELQQLRGRILLGAEPPDPDGAEAAFREAILLAEHQSTPALALRAAISLARLLASLERPKDAREALLPIYESFHEGFDTPDLIDARKLLEELAA